MASSFERRRLRFYLGLMIGDASALMVAFLIAGYIYIGRNTGMIVVLLPAQLLIPGYLTIALQNGSYSLQSLQDWRTAALRALLALLVSAALLNFVAFFAKINTHFSRVGFVIGMAASVVLLVGMRQLAFKVIRPRWGPSLLNVLVIDDGGPPVELRHTYRLVTTDIAWRPSLNDPHTLDLFARHARNMDQVIVSCPPGSQDRLGNRAQGLAVCKARSCLTSCARSARSAWFIVTRSVLRQCLSR